jgi:5-formyltetrahydrofolate cyclo-ligase
VDLALVPGLAFDASGRRLGHGGGHFDRLLARTAGLRAGVAFEVQMVRRVPVDAHDVNMDAVITDKRKYEIKNETKPKRNRKAGGLIPRSGRSRT